MRVATLVPLGVGPSSQTNAVFMACRLLKEGNIIAIPTDTIYGIAASAQNTTAVRRIYAAKSRDVLKPVAVCVGNVEDIPKWGKADLLPSGLLKALLPGPVTVVLERTPLLNPELNPTVRKVGIRVPDHPFVQEIAQKLKTPLALTSANLSNEPSCLNPVEFESLWSHLAAVFDGGCLGSSSSARAGSTVVDLSIEGRYDIVRSGSALTNTLAILHKYGLKPADCLKENLCS